MLDFNTFHEVLILCFHKEKYHKYYYMEIDHAIDDPLFGLWAGPKEGVCFALGGRITLAVQHMHVESTKHSLWYRSYDDTLYKWLPDHDKDSGIEQKDLKLS